MYCAIREKSITVYEFFILKEKNMIWLVHKIVSKGAIIMQYIGGYYR